MPVVGHGSTPPTDCTAEQLEFQGLGRRRAEAAFDAGHVASDAGALLLREIARASRMERAAACFRGLRDPSRVEHGMAALVARRIYALALGYEDLNDHDHPPRQIILDLDAADDPVPGMREGCFVHGRYRHDRFLPPYVFCGEHLPLARLRPSNLDASAGSAEELTPILQRVWARWPKTQVVLRADSCSARVEIMAWCNANEIDHVFGLANYARLIRKVARESKRARRRFARTGQAARFLRDFSDRTVHRWSGSRRVVGKAEHLEKGSTPPVRHHLAAERPAEGVLRSALLRPRGDEEPHQGTEQLDLFANRTSAATMSSNQLRLYFSSFADVLLHHLRRVGLRMASGDPHAQLFAQVLANLRHGLSPGGPACSPNPINTLLLPPGRSLPPGQRRLPPV